VTDLISKAIHAVNEEEQRLSPHARTTDSARSDWLLSEAVRGLSLENRSCLPSPHWEFYQLTVRRR
jgi:hypothetical protein